MSHPDSDTHEAILVRYRHFLSVMREAINHAASKHPDGKRVYLVMFLRDLLVLHVDNVRLKTEFNQLYDVGMTTHVAKSLDEFTEPLIRSYLLGRLINELVDCVTANDLDAHFFGHLIPNP